MAPEEATCNALEDRVSPTSAVSCATMRMCIELGHVGVHRQRPLTGNKTGGMMGISRLIRLVSRPTMLIPISSTMPMAISSSTMLTVRQHSTQVLALCTHPDPYRLRSVARSCSRFSRSNNGLKSTIIQLQIDTEVAALDESVTC